jgi:hypothetical protein
LNHRATPSKDVILSADEATIIRDVLKVPVLEVYELHETVYSHVSEYDIHT